MSHASEARHSFRSIVPTWGAIAAASELRARLADRLDRYRLYRRTLDELTWLTDRELQDLGIFRADIRALAREAAYGRA